MKKIGIIGGGQLGKMMILDGKRLDTQFAILDPTEHCPAHSIADRHVVADFDDVDAILRMAEDVDVVTYEFEHISVEALRRLEAEGHKVYPSAETLSRIQNKLVQKRWLAKHEIPVPVFRPVDGVEDIHAAAEEYGYPIILKTCTGGYDGKGNAVIETGNEIAGAYETLGAGKLPLMVEECIDFEKEVSILACRSENGEMAVFPVAENVHHNSILDETTVPAVISEDSVREAMEVAKACLQAFDACGMLCIELFVTREGHILVNELAPRPHNSGHYTIEGCYTSQYEQHVRAILEMPLGNPNLIRPTAMKNLIGDRNGQAELTGLEEAYRFPNVKVHIYGKEQVKVGRKMGHITATGETLEEALAEVRGAHAALHI
ncbi:MAG: 5-(carboxyamino)imidazole ribonucleotide synthase [Lachnospiraceae bacterium]|nr:5-(carboxyamino)imidazole ribonucleotide synthase [Lachnospiraceae bacterium]